MKKLLLVMGVSLLGLSFSCNLFGGNFIPMSGGEGEVNLDIDKYLPKSDGTLSAYVKSLITQYLATAEGMDTQVEALIGPDGTKDPKQVKTYKDATIKEIKDAAGLSIGAQTKMKAQLALLRQYATDAEQKGLSDADYKQLQEDIQKAMDEFLKQVSEAQIEGAVAVSLGQDSSVTAANAAQAAQAAKDLATARDAKQKAVDTGISAITAKIAEIQSKYDALPDTSDLAGQQAKVATDLAKIKAANPAPYLATYVDKLVPLFIPNYTKVVNAKDGIVPQMKPPEEAKAELLTLKVSIASGAKDTDNLAAIQALVDAQTKIANDAASKVTPLLSGVPSAISPFADSCFIDKTGCDALGYRFHGIALTTAGGFSFYRGENAELDSGHLYYMCQSLHFCSSYRGIGTSVDPSTFEVKMWPSGQVGYSVWSDDAYDPFRNGLILVKKNLILLSNGTTLQP